MSIKDTTKNIGSKLKLDSHHAIERFGVIVSGLAVTVLVILVSSMGYSIEKHRQQLGSQAMYTMNFTTSKTQVKGTVEGVYASKDKTKTMVLLKFADVAKVSTSASEYQSFLTASDLNMKQEKIKGNPAGSIYMFGTTGYMGVYLVDAGGFDSQVLNLTLRAKAELVTPQSSGSSGQPIDDGSFAKYDQFRVYFNPGASGATQIPALDDNVPEVRDLYNQMVVEPQEKEIRTTLDSDLKKMQTDLTAIDDYTRRLTTTTIGTSGLKVVAPSAMSPSRVPSLIDGDKVTGKEAVGNTPSTLKLESPTVLNGGYNFDWRSGSVGQGYLDQLVPEGMDYITFLGKQASAQSSSIDVAAIDWTLTNGQLLKDTDTTVTAFKPVNDIVQLLSTAYQTYFTDKQTYETDTLPKLINLEVGLKDVEANHTINTDKNAVLVY